MDIEPIIEMKKTRKLKIKLCEIKKWEIVDEEYNKCVNGCIDGIGCLVNILV